MSEISNSQSNDPIPSNSGQVKDSVINVNLNRSALNNGAVEIDIVKIFKNMKSRRWFFCWMMGFLALIGMCIPLLLYQFQEHPYDYKSVVTLTYEGSENLMAPDGEPLDLSMVSSSYVLSEAIKGLNLSQPLSLESIKNNISIEKIITEDSRRTQELISGMMDVSNTTASAYENLMNFEVEYENQFIVSLKNGFGNEDMGRLLYLDFSELAILLDRILNKYNDFLCLTYAENLTPDNEFSVIDINSLDLLDSLDLLNSAIDHLDAFLDEKNPEILSYRSRVDGLSLNDLRRDLAIMQSVDVDYLYSYVYSNSIVKDEKSMITSLKFQLRNYEQNLAVINEKIENTSSILANYKNDEIFVSSQNANQNMATTATTDYYNTTVLEQVVNYGERADLLYNIANTNDKLTALGSTTSSDITKAHEELIVTLHNCMRMYDIICNHLQEINESDFYSVFTDHTSATGKAPSLFGVCGKNMAIYAIIGLFIGFCWWGIEGIAMQFKEEPAKGKRGV